MTAPSHPAEPSLRIPVTGGSMADYDRLRLLMFLYGLDPSIQNWDLLDAACERCGAPSHQGFNTRLSWIERRVQAFERLMSNLSPALNMVEAYC